jgi:hypothetical protein
VEIEELTFTSLVEALSLNTEELSKFNWKQEQKDFAKILDRVEKLTNHPECSAEVISLIIKHFKQIIKENNSQPDNSDHKIILGILPTLQGKLENKEHKTLRTDDNKSLPKSRFSIIARLPSLRRKSLADAVSREAGLEQKTYNPELLTTINQIVTYAFLLESRKALSEQFIVSLKKVINEKETEIASEALFNFQEKSSHQHMHHLFKLYPEETLSFIAVCEELQNKNKLPDGAKEFLKLANSASKGNLNPNSTIARITASKKPLMEEIRNNVELAH